MTSSHFSCTSVASELVRDFIENGRGDSHSLSYVFHVYVRNVYIWESGDGKAKNMYLSSNNCNDPQVLPKAVNAVW